MASTTPPYGEPLSSVTPGGLRAVRPSGATENIFDRLARATADAMSVPIAVLALTDERGVVWDGVAFSPEGPGEVRDFPATKRFAEAVFAQGEPLHIVDVNAHPLAAELHVAPRPDEVALAGVPVAGSDGRAVGVLCAVDADMRLWSDADLRVLSALAATFGAELALRSERDRRRAAEWALRHAEGRQQESDERYRLLLENASEAIFVHREGRILYVNPAGVSLLRAGDAAAVVGTFILDVVAPPFRGIAAHRLEQLSAGRSAGGLIDYDVVRPDGTEVEVEVTSVPIIYEGKPAVQTLAQDVSDQRRAERALRESEERYRLLFEASPVPTFLYDRRSLRILAANDATLRLYGYDRAAFLGLTITALQAPEVAADPARVRAFADTPAREDHVPCARRHRRRDGSLLDVEVTVFDSPHGGHDARIVVVADVTERSRAERLVRQSEAKYRGVMERASDGLVLVDAEGRVREANARFGELLGRAPASLVDTPVLALLGEADGDRAPLPAPPHAGGAPLIERRLVRADGSALAIEIGVTPLDSGDALLIVRDITERIRIEAELRHAQKMEALGRLAEGVARDFNNVLTVVACTCDALLASPLDAGTRDGITDVRRAASGAAGLTRRLLAFGRPATTTPRPLGINDVVRNAARLAGLALGADAPVQLELGPDAGWVRADPTQLEQLLMDLVVRAQDALPAGAAITVATAGTRVDDESSAPLVLRAGPYVVVRIAPDTGGARAAAEPALASVRAAVAAHGGALICPPIADGGGFVLYLPAERAPAAGAPRRPSGETVLVVEDEDSVRASVRRVLEEEGYTVLTVARGDDALRLVAEHQGQLQLVLTDVVMPGMNGRELADRLSTVRPDLKLLFMSGYNDLEIWRRGLPASWPLLHKPFDSQTLARTVREALDGA